MTCECGCGNPTGIAKHTDRRHGWVMGEPRRFLRGHHRKLLSAPSGCYRRVRVAGIERPAHVVVAEKAIGKSLPFGAEVHHVDQDRQNNVPLNLVICQDHAYHRLLHARMRVAKAGGDPNKQNLCRECLMCMDFKWFHRNLGNAALGTCTICKECQSRKDATRYLRNRLEEEQRLTR